MSSAWQHPFVNVFKHCGVGQWKKCSKEGDVAAVMDREIKATVYRISGSISAGSYIHLPKTSSQSLGLTGRYLYLVFRPQPSKFFAVHIEVATESGLAVRISFSNLFKEFKCTSTWLKLPYVAGSEKENAGILEGGSCSSRPTSALTHWTLLVLDLKTVLSKFLHAKYAYLKNVKLCANLLVKNVFTSDVEYSPFAGGERQGYVQPLPREMVLPVAKGREFSEMFDYIRFPSEPSGVKSVATFHKPLSGMPSGLSLVHTDVRGGGGERDRGRRALGDVGQRSRGGGRQRETGRGLLRSQPHALSASSSRSQRSIASSDGGGEHVMGVGCGGREGERLPEVHVYAARGAEVTVHHDRERSTGTRHRAKVSESTPKRSIILKSTRPKEPQIQSLEPDPILRLQKVIGFGGHSTGQVLFSGDGRSVVYPCHSLVVDMEIVSHKQRFFVGHTAKVSCLALNGGGTLLASGQAGSQPVVRIWRFESRQCLALFKTHSQGLHSLSFSHSGGVLCGVGRDSHGRNMVVLWDTSVVGQSSEVTVLAKAHTEASIENLRIAQFDDSRMVSCGWDNVRFWRVRGGSLRSCPVNLEEHHQLHFSGIAFQSGYHSESDLTDRNVYVCTKNGFLFEIHYKSITVRRVWHLLPSNEGGCVAINSLYLHEAFCVTGSDDGFLRLWPLDFSTVFLEVEHEGAVTAVGVSEDGLKVLAGTSSGNVGVLDAGDRSYTTLMRSHTGPVQCVSVGSSHNHLVTCSSSDHTIRVWDLQEGTQLFDFRAPGEAPCCVCSHPTREVFACGFQTGAVRIFHTPSSTLLAEHRQHQGAVTGLVFSPSGHRLYSSSASGSLAMYDSEQQNCRLLRLLGNTVAKGERFGPRALSLSRDGRRLAFVGPLEFTISVVDASTLDEILRMDITSMAPSPSSVPAHSVDHAHLVCFAPPPVDQLVVVTSGARLLKFSASSGQLLSEVSHVHRRECTALSVSGDGRFLLTAGERVVKVWDYCMTLDLNFQVFIGHSEPVSQVQFTPDGSHVISCGDAIFIWDFLASQPTTLPPPPPSTPPHTPTHLTSTMSTSPRKRVPAPVNYEPLKMHSFTPLAPTPTARQRTSAAHRVDSPTDFPNMEEDEPPLNVDDDHLYHPHSGSEGSEEDEQHHSGNINHFTHRLREGGGEEEGGNSVEEEEVVIEHGPDQEVEVVVEPQPSESHMPRPREGEELPRPQTSSKPKALKHYKFHCPSAPLAPHLYMAPTDQAGLRRKAVLGLSGRGRNNVIWLPSTGLFVYSSGCIVIIEDLSNGQQRHLTGHSEEVSTLAAQHDGQVLVSASASFNSTPCEMRVWRVSSNKCSKVLTFHLHAVSCMAYSRDDRFLLSVGTFQESTLAVWSSRDYSLLSATPLSHAVHEVRWDPLTAYEFTTVGTQGSVSFWLLEEGEGGEGGGCKLQVHEPPVPTELLTAHARESLEFTSLAYGPNNTLFIGSNTGLITLWDTRENKCVMYWKTDPSEIGSMFCSGGKLVTGSVSRALQLWSVDTSISPPAVAMEIAMETDGAVFSAAFDSRVELGVVGTSAGTVWYVNWPERTKVKLVSGHTEQILSVTFCEGGSHFASCGVDGSLVVWSVETMEQTTLFQAPRKACTCVAFSPLSPSSAITTTNEEGPPPPPSSLAPTLPPLVAGYRDGALRVFDLGRVQMARKMQPHAAPVRAVVYSRDGHVIISGCAGGLVAVSNPSTGLVVRVITDHQGAPITDIHVASRTVQLPSLGDEECQLWLVASGDRRVSVWRGEWGRDSCQLVDWLTFPGPAFAPDGTKLRKGHKCQYELLPPSLARFSPSDPDTIIYTGYGLERCVQFYSLSRKAVVRTVALTHWATSMDVSPQGHLLAFGCQERVVKLMDYEEGSFQDYTGHHDGITSVHFSPCGQLLLSTSHSIIHVWTIALH